MSLTFTPATKTALKARVALAGTAGCGKTWTSLLFARTLAGPEGRIAVVDTERGSASKYSRTAKFPQGFVFDTLRPDRFAPELLTEALAAAGQAGYDVMVVDSLSHFWMGTGGMLESVDNVTKRQGASSSFSSGWKEMRPHERRMLDALLGYPGHVIVTMRTKTEWVMETNARGKQQPTRVGTKAEQREGIEFEFDVVGEMDLEHTLVVSKSRCPALADAVLHKPGPEVALALLDWLDDGDAPTDTAQGIRDELLANPTASTGEITGYANRAKAAGLLGTAIVDETGETATLGDWLRAKWNAANAEAAKAPAGDPS